MKSLLTVTALFEGATGIALMVMPAAIVPLLLGISFTEPGLNIVSGITGAALIALAIACWLSRDIGPHTHVLVKAMLFYNIASSLVLLYGGLGLQLSGMGLYPACAAHIGLAIWCIRSLRKT